MARIRLAVMVAAALILSGMAPGTGAVAQEAPDAPRSVSRPEPRPQSITGIAPDAAPEPEEALPTDLTVAAVSPEVPRDPNRGAVTNLPLPRYVTLKTSEGNARRGPGLSHRIDWVFTRVGMPLRVTAEYENWRRVEDAEGAGGWMHYALLSGTRSVLVAQNMTDIRSKPQDDAGVLMQAETGVVARLMECSLDWCRLSLDGERGWVRKAALWGVEAGEVIE